jgi:hypothetical protein
MKWFIRFLLPYQLQQKQTRNYQIHSGIEDEEKEEQGLSLRSCLEIKPSWKSPQHWILHFYWDAEISHTCIRLNFQPNYLHLWGKLKKWVWIQICTRGTRNQLWVKQKHLVFLRVLLIWKHWPKQAQFCQIHFGMTQKTGFQGVREYLFHHSKIHQ